MAMTTLETGPFRPTRLRDVAEDIRKLPWKDRLKIIAGLGALVATSLLIGKALPDGETPSRASAPPPVAAAPQIPGPALPTTPVPVEIRRPATDVCEAVTDDELKEATGDLALKDYPQLPPCTPDTSLLPGLPTTTIYSSGRFPVSTLRNPHPIGNIGLAVVSDETTTRTGSLFDNIQNERELCIDCSSDNTISGYPAAFLRTPAPNNNPMTVVRVEGENGPLDIIMVTQMNKESYNMTPDDYNMSDPEAVRFVKNTQLSQEQILSALIDDLAPAT